MMRTLTHLHVSSFSSLGDCERWIGRSARQLATTLLIAAAFLGNTGARAQTADRVAPNFDAMQVKALPGHRPAWATAANDAGPAPAALAMNGMTAVLARSPRQEQAFEQLLRDQQNPASPEYHHWLTPAEVGERFGVSENDLAAVTGWLQSQGLRVGWVAPSRMFIGFSGTAADVGRAFQAEVHAYRVNGQQRISIASDPMLPQALVPVVKAIHGLFTVEEEPQSQSRAMPSASPQENANSGAHFMTPADFNTIYDLPSGLTGSGVTIGIVSESRTNFADFANFRNLTGASFANPTEVVPTAFGGIDPGPAFTVPPPSGTSTSVQGEATLDVIRAGGVAPGATLLLVAATGNSGGIHADAEYLVNTSPVPAQVMNISFGGCELNAGSAGVALWDTLFQQAAAEGISVFVSSGDSGASGCDAHGGPPPTTPEANNPNYICSSTYATCVGGTEFNDAPASNYWSSNNGANLESAIGYIPEGGWNEPLTSSGTGQVNASGGGVSNVIATPSWQTGAGVPAARAGRYTPDVAFSSAGHDGYFACFAAGAGSCVAGTGGGYQFEYFFGTSAAAPSMAGIAALLDQKLAGAQGNLNPEIYSMAASEPAAFHDATVATSGVTGCAASTPSMCNNSIPSPTGLTGGQPGFLLTAGYDEVTGLGSLDAKAFIDNFAAPLLKPTVALNLTASSISTTQSVSATVTVNDGAGNPTPTGTATLSVGSVYSQVLTLSGGTATLAIPSGRLPAGSYTVRADYAPDSASTSVYNGATGTSSLTVTAAAKIAPSSLSVLPSPASATTAQSVSVVVAVNGGTGNPTPTGTVTLTSGSYNSGAVALSLATGNATILVPAGSLAVGNDTLTATYPGDSNYTSIGNTATVAVASAFAIAGSAVSVSPGATTGNTSTITVTPAGGFTGSVTLSAAITASPNGAQFPPTVTVGPSPVTISSTTAQTATLTVSTTAPTTSAVEYPFGRHGPWSSHLSASGGAALACVLLMAFPFRRRGGRSLLGLAALFFVLSSSLMACGGGGGGSGGNQGSPGTTAGAYTVTVTGVSTTDTSAQLTTTTTITLTVQ